MQFQFGDQFLQLLMEIFKLAVSQFADLRPTRLLVGHLKNVYYLPVAFCLVIDDLGFEVHHVCPCRCMVMDE